MIIVTAVLVYITQKYVKYTYQMVEEIRTQNRPYIFIDFEIFQSLFELAISNIGSRVAHNVKFSFSEDIINSQGKHFSEIDVLKNGISYFPPQRRFLFDFDYAKSTLLSSNSKLLQFTVRYFDDNGKEYSGNFKYDLSIYDGMSFRSFSDSGNQLSYDLQEIARELRNGLPNRLSKGLYAGEVIGKKPCPICHEYINNEAQKCRFCCEWLKLDISKENDTNNLDTNAS